MAVKTFSTWSTKLENSAATSTGAATGAAAGVATVVATGVATTAGAATTGVGAGAATVAVVVVVFLAAVVRLAGVAELMLVICVTEEFFYSIKRGGNTSNNTNLTYNQFCPPEREKNGKNAVN